MMLEEISKNLERLFAFLINETRPKDFFILLNDYADYILKTPILKTIVEKAIKKKSKTGRARRLEIGECFDTLLNFQNAFEEALNDSNPFDVFQKYARQNKNRFGYRDPAEIFHMTEGLKRILGGKQTDFLNIEEFKNCIRRIYNYLLIELSQKVSTEDEGVGKKIIVIDPRRGIYDAKNHKLIYEIRGKRLKIVEYLLEKNASLNDLVGHTGQSPIVISRAIKKINEIFRKKLKIKIDLIIHSKTSGYKLNREQLIIKNPP